MHYLMFVDATLTSRRGQARGQTPAPLGTRKTDFTLQPKACTELYSRSLAFSSKQVIAYLPR